MTGIWNWSDDAVVICRVEKCEVVPIVVAKSVIRKKAKQHPSLQYRYRQAAIPQPTYSTSTRSTRFELSEHDGLEAQSTVRRRSIACL